MKRFLLLAAALPLMAQTPPPAAMPGMVAVTLTGVKAKGGTMRVSLYDEKAFLRADAPYHADAKVTAAGELSVMLHGVPAGDYAIAAFHDADDDGKMGMDGGRMTEGTALSRAAELRAMPTFATTKVAVPAAGLRIRLAMTYPEDRQGW